MQNEGISTTNTNFNCSCEHTVTTVNIDSPVIIANKAKVDL